MSHLIVSYPEFLANSLRMNKADFEREMKIFGIIKLFELGKISSGTASKVLEISRLEFLDILSKYHVTFIDSDNLSEDVLNA